MRTCKQSTAYNLTVFMTDSSDHVTGKTGLTLTITASKDGAAFASISPTVTELATGWYKLALTSSHTDTVGDLALHITATGADPTDVAVVVRARVTDDLAYPATSGRSLDVDSSGRVLLQPTQTGVTIPTVTTLTNAPSDSSGVTTLLSRIPSGLFTGITSLAQWLGLIAGKQTGDSTARTELRATGAGSGTFDETTDSAEAIRDRGDAAWATATGFSTLDAAGVRTAVGLASANLDTQLDALPTAAENAAEVLDLAAGVETGLTLRQAMRLLVAAEAAKLSGAATTTITIRNYGDSKNRITATVDADGNRTAMSYDLT